MSFIRIWAMAGCVSLLALAGCADTVERELGPEMTQLEKELAKRDLREGESLDRIPNYNFTSWNYVDNQHVLVTMGVSRHYLVTLRSYCHGLTGSQNVRFATVGADLTTLDQLIVNGQRCQIDEIRKLEPVPEEESERDD